MFVMKFYLQFKIHFKNGKLFSKIKEMMRNETFLRKFLRVVAELESNLVSYAK